MKLDHLVYFSRKSPLENVKEQQQKGFHAIPGGSHLQWGTQNALLYCSNAYIEWLSIESAEIAEKSTHPLTQLLIADLKLREGWGTCCIGVNGMEEFKTHLRKKGIKTSIVIPAQRKTPEGQILKWKMLFIKQEGFEELPFPFFIEWETPDDIRLKNLRENGGFPKGNESIKVRKCIFHTTAPKMKCEEWKKLLNLKESTPNILELSNQVQFIFKSKDKNEKSRLYEVRFNTNIGIT